MSASGVTILPQALPQYSAGRKRGLSLVPLCGLACEGRCSMVARKKQLAPDPGLADCIVVPYLRYYEISSQNMLMIWSELKYLTPMLATALPCHNVTSTAKAPVVA